MRAMLYTLHSTIMRKAQNKRELKAPFSTDANY